MYSPTWPEVPDKLTFYLLLSRPEMSGDTPLEVTAVGCSGKPHDHSSLLQSKKRVPHCPVFTSQRNREKAADVDHTVKSKGKRYQENQKPNPRWVTECVTGFLSNHPFPGLLKPYLSCCYGCPSVQLPSGVGYWWTPWPCSVHITRGKPLTPVLPLPQVRRPSEERQDSLFPG